MGQFLGVSGLILKDSLIGHRGPLVQLENQDVRKSPKAISSELENKEPDSKTKVRSNPNDSPSESGSETSELQTVALKEPGKTSENRIPEILLRVLTRDAEQDQMMTSIEPGAEQVFTPFTAFQDLASLDQVGERLEEILPSIENKSSEEPVSVAAPSAVDANTEPTVFLGDDIFENLDSDEQELAVTLTRFFSVSHIKSSQSQNTVAGEVEASSIEVGSTAVEPQKVIEEKRTLREEIFSIAKHASLLSISDTEMLKKSRAELSKEEDLVKAMQLKLETRLKAEEAEQGFWKKRQKEIPSLGTAKVGERVAQRSALVLREQEQYQKMLSDYFSIEEAWRTKPSAELSKKLGSLGTKMRNKKADLERVLEKVIEESLKAGSERIADLLVVLDRSQLLEQRIKKAKKVAENLKVRKDSSRRIRELLLRQGQLFAELEAYQKMVSDTEETRLRRELLVQNQLSSF